jgi:hypothetical protein
MLKFACVSAVALVAFAAQADIIRLDTSAFSAGVGGEFTATPLSGNVGLTGLAGDLSPDSFQTFCLEYNEHFRPGNLFTVVLNTGAVGGGTPSGFDPLDPRTAYLYTLFRTGSLGIYNYGASRRDTARDLQRAIWFIEDEEGGVNNHFVALANAAVAPGGEWFGRGLGDVRVMNLYNQNGTRAQDQLTLIPTPGALALLGLAAVSLRRRLR